MTNNAINGIIINIIITSDSPFRLVWQETQLVVCSSHLLLSLCGFSPGFCGLRVGHMPGNKTSEDINIYHIIYKSSNRNKVRDKFGITYFEKLITMQIRSRD